MDVSKLSSDEVNREIALRRQEWVLDYGHHELYVLWEDPRDPYDRYDWNWRRVPVDYLEWGHCGPLLEEIVGRRLGWHPVEDDYGCAIRDRRNVPVTVPYSALTDAIRRAWLAWRTVDAD